MTWSIIAQATDGGSLIAVEEAENGRRRVAIRKLNPNHDWDSYATYDSPISDRAIKRMIAYHVPEAEEIAKAEVFTAATTTKGQS